LGKRHLEQALDTFPYKDHVEIEYRSFELNPDQPKYAGINVYQLLAEKYRMSIEDAVRANERVGREAVKVGLKYNFDDMKPTNTFVAHRLSKYAKTVGKDMELMERIFQSYFIEGKLISDHTTLCELAVAEGLDKERVVAVLEDSSKFEHEVRGDEALAKKYGINGVPFYLINNKYAISGAQPVDVILQTLQNAWQNDINAK
jgi:protein disulfide-isomerase